MMQQVDKNNTAPFDFSFSEDEARQKIIKALGTRKNFSNEDKHNFSYAVVKSTPEFLMLSEHLESIGQNRNDLCTLTAKALEAVEKLQEATQQNLYAFSLCSIASVDVSDTLDSWITPQNIRFYLKALDRALSSFDEQNVRKRLAIAVQVGRLYREHFNDMPTFKGGGKNETSQYSPYERVCDVVAKYIKLEPLKPNSPDRIPKSTIIAAIDFLKQEKKGGI